MSDLLSELQSVRSYFSLLSNVILELSHERADKIALALTEAYERNTTVFLFGNGGSASLASHFACDLGKGTGDPRGSRRRFRALALTDNIPTMTAWANDSGYEHVFAEQLRNLVEPGDVALAISCSGNSPNVLKALKVARENGAVTIGLGGFRGGKMRDLCDICLIVPSDNMQIIEDVHLSVAHAVFTIVKNRISISENQKAVAVGVASSAD